ncbi:MAG: flagellar brake protein [Gammaproteobacteria bacterium]|nr:flagellar brake protein [Gammaproteobacteria bacterium]
MTETTLIIAAGSTLELESTADSILNNMHTEFIGYTQSQDLILSHPKIDNIQVTVETGDIFFASLKQGETDISFETRVIAVINTPYPHLHTTCPDAIRTGAPRKSNRIAATLANVYLVLDDGEDNHHISILNISVSGACLVAEKHLGTVNNILQIEIHAEAGLPPVRIDCMVRHIQEVTEKNHYSFHHGVEFIGMDAEVQLFLWKLVQKSANIQQLKRGG